MPKTKPFEYVATRFHISGESAKYFLGRVQKSFKSEKPPQQLIVEFMQTKKFKSLPEPHHVATMLNEEGIWVEPLHAAPPVAEDDDDKYFR